MHGSLDQSGPFIPINRVVHVKKTQPYHEYLAAYSSLGSRVRSNRNVQLTLKK